MLLREVEYARPASVDEAVRLLAAHEGARALAGGQTLINVMKARAASPDALVDLGALDELKTIELGADGSLELGAMVTYTQLMRAVEARARPILGEVASQIADVQVRNRGTIGGSVCHADPAADWVSVLTLLSSIAVIEGASGRREMPLEQFITGTFATALEESELLVGLRIPKLSANARWGHYKFCRKPGEFAEAIGAVLSDPERGVWKAVIGAGRGAPYVIPNAHFLVDRFESGEALAAVEAAGLGDDPYERQVHFVALKRAAMQLASR